MRRRRLAPLKQKEREVESKGVARRRAETGSNSSQYDFESATELTARAGSSRTRSKTMNAEERRRRWLHALQAQCSCRGRWWDCYSVLNTWSIQEKSSSWAASCFDDLLPKFFVACLNVFRYTPSCIIPNLVSFIVSVNVVWHSFSTTITSFIKSMCFVQSWKRHNLYNWEAIQSYVLLSFTCYEESMSMDMNEYERA